MGVTSQSMQIIQWVLSQHNIHSVLDLGAQNDYRDEMIRLGKKAYISEWWKSVGRVYASIDLSGENNCLVHDLSQPIQHPIQYDLTMDFGTIEHVYNMEAALRNMHNLTKAGGIMIRENPEIGSWPMHGFHYISEQWARDFGDMNGYEVLDVRRIGAMGNYIDGWNILAVYRKTATSSFNGLPVGVLTIDDVNNGLRSQEALYKRS